MAQIGKNLMVLDQDCVVVVAELLTYAFATRLLSGLKCEVMLFHVEASLQWLIVLVFFN
jgi:hypothetical protein